MGAAKLKVKSWRLRVFLVELSRALKEEREGKAVVVNMDESYVHQGHCANMTWLPMDENGNPIVGLNRQVRDGQRLILVIATSRWGPIVVRDECGRPIVDREWSAKEGRYTFCELNRFGWPRRLTEGLVNDNGDFEEAELKTRLSKLNDDELGLLAHLDGNTPCVYHKAVLGGALRPALPINTPVEITYQAEEELEEDEEEMEEDEDELEEDEDEGELVRTSSTKSNVSDDMKAGARKGLVPTVYDAHITEVEMSTDPDQPHKYTVEYEPTVDDENIYTTCGAIIGEDLRVDETRLNKAQKKAIRATEENAIFRRIHDLYQAEKTKDDENYATLTQDDRIFLQKAWDLAPTTEMMYVAGQSSGDYHKNMDTQMFLKWTKRLELAYPLWCQQMDELRSKGKLYPAVPQGPEHRFWDDENNKPARKLYCLLDNAPYHHGGEVNVLTWSKKRCAKELNRLGIKSIKIRLASSHAADTATDRGQGRGAGEGQDEGQGGGEAAGVAETVAAMGDGGQGGGREDDATESEEEEVALGPGTDDKGHFVRIAVPDKGSSFAASNRTGGYSPDQVARATLEAIAAQAPAELVQPVRAIFQKHNWGLIWTPPYTSPWCWIELFWLAGKCFVAAPPQQMPNRHLKHVADQLYTKWYGLNLVERSDLSMPDPDDELDSNKVGPTFDPRVLG